MCLRAPEVLSEELESLSILSTFNPDPNLVEPRLFYKPVAHARMRTHKLGYFVSNAGLREQAPNSGIIPQFPGELAGLLDSRNTN